MLKRLFTLKSAISIQKVFLLLWVLLITDQIYSQNCSDWLRLPSFQSYVSVGDLDITGNKVTLEAVFTRTAPYSGGYNWAGDLVSKHNTPSDCNYLLRPNNAEITTTNGTYFTTPPICEIQLNKTYHVAMVYDGTRLKFYRDGFLMSSVAATGNLFQNNFQTRIGLYDAIINNTQLVGYINEVRIWNIARTQDQIRAYMNAALPNPTSQAGLLAYYRFDNLLNKQGNATWNGTIGGSASINEINPFCTFVADSCGLPQETIINHYTEAISLGGCKNTLTVANAADFHVGDTVLLIQMKGATIDNTNTGAFGTILNYGSAGNYEFNYVKAKAGNELELRNTVVRPFDFLNGKVQLVRVPYFTNLVVNNKLSCLPWDGSKGGILVLNVQNSLTLNADIDVSGKGYKGGAGFNTNESNTNCFSNNYSYPFGDIRAAAKGESIVNIPANIALGKGNNASGGGGGNDHNSGGGGGGNGGAGGFGGYQYEPCGNAPFDNRGIGGRVLNYNTSDNKIFMGGGGGAGHENNSVNNALRMDGGNGGGIVLISAQNITGNSHKIISNGAGAPEFFPMGSQHTHEATGGGGAGGTVILNIPAILNNAIIEAQGGKGADMNADVPLYGRIGPGGGGGGGVFWSSSSTQPANISFIANGGDRGVLTQDGNNPWGTTVGNAGTVVFQYHLPAEGTEFQPNIDSVRFNAIPIDCQSFNFEGLGYVKTFPVSSWHWDFGDGNFANTQNASHSYSTDGLHTVKLVITDANGCKDSISHDVEASNVNFDFNYDQDICNPLNVRFTGLEPLATNNYWDFGDNSETANAPVSIQHTYSSTGNYVVRYAIGSISCSDTTSKTITIDVIKDDIVLTKDTTICNGTTKQLRTVPSLDFCWSPTTFLNDPHSPTPITSTTQNITYYFTAKVTGANLIANGNFSQGNTGFGSDYVYANPNLFESQYYVGPSSRAWHGAMSDCHDHTTGTGNMMMVNGSPTTDAKVWHQAINVTPNTNYAFSTWVQSIYPENPAQLQFSINGKHVGSIITATLPTCNWIQFYTTWNSGTNTTADISIVNKNTIGQGNDFALDDISFAPVFIKKDSVNITVENPVVTANADIAICFGSSAQLNATGAQNYTWSPASGLSLNTISNPVASPESSTRYIVTGTTSNGCTAKDTVNVNVFEKSAAIAATGDATICRNSTAQLLATGGVSYNWSPAATLSSALIPNPVASPSSYTKYYVNITDINTCTYLDSVEIDVHPDPVFQAAGPPVVCENDSVQFHASGGDFYSWQPSTGLSDAAVANPKASPAGSTNYLVTITETVCDQSKTLPVNINVVLLPLVKAFRSTDIDCSNDQSQLSASGANSYTWSPAATLSNPAILNPVAHPVATTRYIVKGTDAAGCSNYDSVLVKVDNSNKSGYLMPNAFTPNGDGFNDCYGIRYWGIIYEVEFSIFNRWGERIFFSKDPNACWDGTYKGVQQDPNVFVYMIRAKTNCEESVFRKGTFVLIR